MVKDSGVLLPIFAIASRYGIGTVGKAAYEFIDFLKSSGFSYREILPLNPTIYGNSPYATCDAFAFNYLYIDIDELIDDKLLSSRDLKGLDFGSNPRKVDYGKLYKERLSLLFKAYRRDKNKGSLFNELLNDREIVEYAIYMTLKVKNDFKAWYDRKLEDRFYSPSIESRILKEDKKTFSFFVWTQYIFLKQRDALHDYARSKKIKIVGDIPHFLSYDSVSMYFHPELFLIDKRNQLTYVSGFPPDEFSKFGQKWGNPLYDWQFMKQDGYKWWNKRIQEGLRLYDWVRLNHFRGFYKFYAVPFIAPNAKKGVMMDGPKEDFFKDKLDEPLIASDLGKYSKDIVSFVANFPYPCLRTIYQAFADSREEVRDGNLPSKLPINCVAYLGNHDNPPFAGFVRTIDRESLARLKNVMKSEADLANIDYDTLKDGARYITGKAIDILFASKALHVTLQLQDMLGLELDSRTNIPGVEDASNWTYRYMSHDLDSNIIQRFLRLNEESGRANKYK
jgi:4-alpha-glucanotransferase